MQKKIVTFGEILMRLNPEGYFRFLQSSKFEVSYGGGEANVAVSLANYGMNATFVSKVPEHEIGQCAINELRRYGVDTKFVARGGNRLGVYFCEKGASQRVSKVIYDRENSSISQADPEDFNWDLIFDKADWFHWTGITPALGGRLPEICKAACKAAKERQIPISCDLNFRKKLWTRERANAVMQQLMPYVDVCIANEEDAKNVFGIVSDGTDIDKAQINKNGYIDVARQLTRKFGFRKVAERAVVCCSVGGGDDGVVLVLVQSYTHLNADPLAFGPTRLQHLAADNHVVHAESGIAVEHDDKIGVPVCVFDSHPTAVVGSPSL